MNKEQAKQSLRILAKTAKSLDKWVLVGVVGTLMLSGAALASLTGYVVTYANGQQTIQGSLPPPNTTTYIAYNPVTGNACGSTLKNMAGAQAGLLQNQYNKATSGIGTNSLGSCLSGIAGLPLGIPSLNLAGLMQSLQNAACQAVNTAIMAQVQPLYGGGSALTSMLNPAAAASQLSIPGTNGMVNLGNAINTQTVNINQQSLSGSTNNLGSAVSNSNLFK